MGAPLLSTLSLSLSLSLILPLRVPSVCTHTNETKRFPGLTHTPSCTMVMMIIMKMSEDVLMEMVTGIVDDRYSATC